MEATMATTSTLENRHDGGEDEKLVDDEAMKMVQHLPVLLLVQHQRLTVQSLLSNPETNKLATRSLQSSSAIVVLNTVLRGAVVFVYWVIDFLEAFTAWLVDFLLTYFLSVMVFYLIVVFIKCNDNEQKKSGDGTKTETTPVQRTRLKLVAFYVLLLVCVALAAASFAFTALKTNWG